MEIKVQIKLTDSEASAIVETAIPAITYWAQSAGCNGVATTLFVDAHEVSGEEHFAESKCLADSNYQYRVRKVDLQRGLALAIERSDRTVCAQLATHMRPGGFGVAGLDREACDIVVQLAVYGEIRFG